MGVGLMVWAGPVVLVWLVVLSGYDIRQRRLPNALTLPGAAVILAVAHVTGRGLPALAGAAALAGVYLLVHVAAPAAMGGGDVKLAIGLGALTGSFGTGVWVLAAVAAPLLTALWGIVAALLCLMSPAMRLRRSGQTVPHGPSMCVASVTAAGLALL